MYFIRKNFAFCAQSNNEAAGKEKILAERAGIGKIARGDIDSYIDANYVRESHRKEYPVRSRSNARMRGLTEERE